MGSVWSSGAVRAAEALLRVAGQTVAVRLRQAGAMPRQDVTLKPCLLRVAGATAELLAGERAVAAAGGAAEVFGVTSRVVAGDVVWRVAGYAPVACGAAVVCWRVQLVR